METTESQKPWYKKTWVIVLGALVAIGIFANIGKDRKNDSAAEESKTNTEQVEKQWTEVYSFSGSGMKKSATFDLSGEPARIKYKYNGPKNIGVGMFAVYVVDEGVDLMVSGGIPEVMTQEMSEESESSIQKSAGTYYLSVNAQGRWEITVEEKK